MPRPDRASGHAIPHHRLAQQWQSMTARADLFLDSLRPSPVVAHLRRALCGSRPDSPCVLAALIRMGLLKIARLQRADIASSPPRAIPSPPHRHHHRTHRRRATALCRNPVRGAQQSVPGLDTPLLSACRRYATTANIPTQHQRRAHSVRSISLTLPSVEPTARRRRATAS